MNKLLVGLTTVATVAAISTSAQSGDWGGIYAGGTASSVTMAVDDTSYGVPFEPSGTSFGGFAGYNFQSGNWVFGAEAAVATGEVGGDDGSYLRPFDRGTTLSIGGRVGFDAGRYLPYVSAGYTSSEFGAYHALGGDIDDYASFTATGTSYAVGVDVAVGSSGFVRAEYQVTQYEDGVFPFYGGSDNHNLTASSESISVGYGFKF